MKGDFHYQNAARQWEEPPELPEMSPEEAEYFLHNEHGECECLNCETFREQVR